MREPKGKTPNGIPREDSLHRFCVSDGGREHIAMSRSKQLGIKRDTHLDETDSSRLLTEALTAKVKTVLADKTSLVSAKAAVIWQIENASGPL